MRDILRVNDPDPKEMSIVEHLEELRSRIIICLSVVTAGSIVGWFVVTPVFLLLEGPIYGYRKSGVEFILTKLTDGFVIELKIAIAVGIALGLPVLLYQAWMFVAPAVSVEARRYAVPFVLLGILLFLIGLGVGYAVFPRVVQFLILQKTRLPDTRFLLTLNEYIAQFALVLILFGAIFELPVVLTFLAMVGVVTSRFLRSKRRYAFVIGLVAAMIVTPGADPITPLITGAVMYALYEFSIVLVRAIHR